MRTLWAPDIVWDTREDSLKGRVFQTEGTGDQRLPGREDNTTFKDLQEGQSGWSTRGSREPTKAGRARPHRACGLWWALGRPPVALISFQAADKLGSTQIVKILTQDTPEFFTDQGHARVAQLIVLEVFASSEALRPLFTLGIVSSAVCHIGSNRGALLSTFPVHPPALLNIATTLITQQGQGKGSSELRARSFAGPILTL